MGILRVVIFFGQVEYIRRPYGNLRNIFFHYHQQHNLSSTIHQPFIKHNNPQHIYTKSNSIDDPTETLSTGKKKVLIIKEQIKEQ